MNKFYIGALSFFSSLPGAHSIQVSEAFNYLEEQKHAIEGGDFGRDDFSDLLELNDEWSLSIDSAMETSKDVEREALLGKLKNRLQNDTAQLVLLLISSEQKSGWAMDGLEHFTKENRINSKNIIEISNLLKKHPSVSNFDSFKDLQVWVEANAGGESDYIEATLMRNYDLIYDLPSETILAKGYPISGNIIYNFLESIGAAKG